MEAPVVRDPGFWSSQAGVVLAPSRFMEEGAEIERRLGGSGTIVFASSGAGGVPKWVSLRREALLASAEMVNAHLEVESGDTWMLALPFFHVGGFGVAARAYAAGCRLQCFAGSWNAMRFAEELEESGATLASLVPAQVHDLIACRLRPPERLRGVVVGGASLDEVEGEEARELGWPILQSYGMTETASQVATAPLADLGKEFRAAPLPLLPGWEHRVDGNGCLQLRGAPLLECYLVLENGTLREEDPIDREGWFTTTDCVEISAGGLAVLGRADRQVKILGELVNVQSLEEELGERLPKGAGVHLLHVPEERRGWRLVPVTEGVRDGVEDVVEILNTQLPGFSRLEAPHFVSALPRTALGKVDVIRLREEVGLPER